MTVAVPMVQPTKTLFINDFPASLAPTTSLRMKFFKYFGASSSTLIGSEANVSMHEYLHIISKTNLQLLVTFESESMASAALSRFSLLKKFGCAYFANPTPIAELLK